MKLHCILKQTTLDYTVTIMDYAVMIVEFAEMTLVSRETIVDYTVSIVVRKFSELKG